MNKELRIIEVDSFITNNGGPNKLPSYFIESYFGIKPNTYMFDINLLKDLY